MDGFLMADAMFIVGVILIAVGVGFIHWFLAPIFVGTVLILLAYCAANNRRPPAPPAVTAPVYQGNDIIN
jgi:hypothetical protein